MSGSPSTTRIWLTSHRSDPPRGLRSAREGTKDVRLRDNADQVLAVEDGERAHLVLEHELGGGPRVPVGARDDHALGHGLAHGESSEQIVDFPHREARGLRGQVQADVTVRYDADETAVFRHEEVPDTLLQHEPPRVEYGGFGTHGDGGSRHELAHFHGTSSFSRREAREKSVGWLIVLILAGR